ncbi:iron ABC transporter permease [Methanoculleus sp. FWC-SCC1]|uniref:Iron ABC transporter permease n=2 Tax=Methanoculleus frigidifontis TaxID=2584085 RepID=A0ABT8MA73_9EURY|nr:iron ABC transporter permease [Methanoculleus sp. FWC-SCC1]
MLYLLPVLLVFFSLFFGRYMLDPVSTLGILIVGSANAVLEAISGTLPLLTGQPCDLPMLEQTWESVESTVIFQIRLPRVLGALLVGGGLSVAGASFQGLFKNPLVSPDILGVSSGAGFGAALAILLSGNPLMIQLSAFCFGIIAVVATYSISRVYKTTSTLVLVLSGIVVGALFSAFLSLLKYLADPYDTLPAIVFWLMGSLSAVSNDDIIAVAPPILIAGFCLYAIRWRINLLSVGEEEARALGVDTERMTGVIIVAATVITASAVCISGIIGWVGLVVPHVGRMFVGPDFRRLIPTSALLGASFLLVVDDISRTLTATEIPLGVLTALIGAPFFAYLLTKKKVGWT